MIHRLVTRPLHQNRRQPRRGRAVALSDEKARHVTEAERAGVIQRVNCGDFDALQALIIEYHDVLAQFAERGLPVQLRARVAPDDVVQDAYVAVFRAFRAGGGYPVAGDGVPEHDGSTGEERASRRPTFESPAQFFAWLRAIAESKLQDVIRAAGRSKRAASREAVAAQQASGSYPDLLARLSATGTTPSRAVSRSESVARLMTCMARLTDAQRDVIRLRILEGVSASEAARRLDRSEDAVHALCYRALAALRSLLLGVT